MRWMEKLRIAAHRAREGDRARLEVLDRLALGPQHSLLVVRFGEEEILIGRSPSALAVLGRIPRGRGPQEESSWEGV